MIQRMLEAIASILDLSGRKAIEDLRRIQIELEEGQEALDWYVIGIGQRDYELHFGPRAD